MKRILSALCVALLAGTAAAHVALPHLTPSTYIAAGSVAGLMVTCPGGEASMHIDPRHRCVYDAWAMDVITGEGTVTYVFVSRVCHPLTGWGPAGEMGFGWNWSNDDDQVCREKYLPAL